MCSPRIASYLAADRPMLLGELPRLTAVPRDRLAVPSVRDSERLCCPSEFSVSLVNPRCCHAGITLFWIGYSLRVIGRLQYCPHWFGQSHSAVGHSLGCVVFLQATRPATFKSPVKPSLEFRLRLESHESNLAGRPQPADSSLGLSLPTAHARPEDPLHAGTPTRFGPPSGFGYPLDGLRPSDPGRFCFAPAALLGFALRSLLLANGDRGITTRSNPLAVSPAGFPIARSDEPAQQAAASGY
jgi:hypothetical protein